MGNNLPHELDAESMKHYTQNLEADDAKGNGSATRRKTSASVNEIRDLYSALQKLVPRQPRPPTTSYHRAPPERTTTSRSERGGANAVECDVVSRRSNPSSDPAFTNRHRSSSPLPIRSQPKIVQRKRSNSCFTISATPNSLAPPNGDFLDLSKERRSSDSSTESQRINEEFSNLIDNFDIEKSSRTKREKNYLTADSSDVEECSSKRRHSGGDLLEERRQKFKDPKARIRRRSIGGSLLLNAIIESDSSRQDSLDNALNIVARRDELQEQETKSSDHFDEVDGRPQQQLTPRNPESNALMSLTDENKVGGNPPAENAKEKDCDVKTQTCVGPEMHNLLEALQELVVTGEGTTPPATSQTNSRRTSWAEKTSPKRKESLHELEAFFMNKLEEISEKENEEGSCRSVQRQTNVEATKVSKNERSENSNPNKAESTKNRFRRSSSAEQYTRATSSNNIHRSRSTVEFLSPTRVAKTRSIEARRASVQIEMNRTNRGGSNSSFEGVSPHERSSLNEKKARTRKANHYSRSNRRKSDIPIIRHEEVLFEATDDEAYKRALWKEDQKAFAKQVNQRLQDWLERATALSLSTAENTEDDNASIDTNPESSKEDIVKAKRAKFAIKKAFQGRIRRSKSLHNILEPQEIPVEKPKSRSPLMERSKQNLLKLGRLRIPSRKVETKSTESDESNESSSCNNRRSAIWYDDDDDSSPEMIPKRNAVDIRGDNIEVKHLSLRRSSCPMPENTLVNSSVDSRRVSRLPVDLPLFYSPGMEPSNLRVVQKKSQNCRQTLSEKENQMPPVCKALFPVKKEIKNGLFYNEPRSSTRVFSPNTSSPPTMDEISIPHAKSCPTTSNDGQFMMFENHDLSKFSDFESFEEFRDRTKSTESEDSGCPNTSDYC